MGIFKNLLEPGAIVLAFTAGALINRHKRIYAKTSPDSLPTSRVSSRPSSPSPRQPRWVPDNSYFRNNVTSRFLATFPFLLEIWYWNLTYWVYQGARALSAHLIRNNERQFDLARQHALFILHLEQTLHVAIEQPLQAAILKDAPWLMLVFARIYYSHILLGVCFIVYCYTYLPHRTFTSIRRTIALDNLIAFIILTVWRCMPPRLLPSEHGFTDVLHPQREPPNGEDWNNNHFQLTIAAMPSLHFGTSLLLAVSIIRFSPHRWLRVLAPLWPTAMLVTILATANHFVLDALVGAMVPVLGWRFNEKLLLLRIPEEWTFWVFRTERPIEFEVHEEGETSALLGNRSDEAFKDNGWLA